MKSFRSAILLVMALLIASEAFAQGRGRIEGRVVDAQGQPLVGVLVKAQKVDNPQEVAEAKSNEKGQFRLERLSNGQWRVEFQQAGLEAEPVVTEVANNRAPEMAVTMTKPDPMVFINAELQRAAKLMQGGDIPGARAVYEALYLKYPQPFQFPFAIATTYAAEKNFDKALEFAKIAAEKDPKSVDVQLLIAEIHMEASRHDEALKVLEGIDLTQVKDPVMFVNAGIIMINNKRSEEAVAMFDRLLAQWPDQHNLHYYRGRAHVAGQKLPEAKADLEKFLSLAPDSKEAADAKNLIAEIDKVLAGKKDGGK
jgi:tetratricopeptide (TPR) repeat protein